eukprot:537911_1
MSESNSKPKIANPWEFTNRKKRKNENTDESAAKRKKNNYNNSNQSSSTTISKKNKKKNKKTTTTKHKKLSYIILKKTYNIVVSAFQKEDIKKDLTKHIVISNIKIKSNDKEEKDEEEQHKCDNQHQLFPKILINEEEEKELKESTLDVAKKDVKIMENMQFICGKLDLMINDDIANNKLSMDECRKILTSKYGDPIKKNDNDNKWYCIDVCVKYYERVNDFKLYNKGRTDSYVVGGYDRNKPDRALRHCKGGLHEVCNERKKLAEGKEGNMDKMIRGMVLSDREVLCRDTLIVYGDYKRSTISSNCFVIQRTLSARVDHWMERDGPWIPKIEDMQYANNDRHDYLRKQIAAYVRETKVKAVVEAAGARNFLIDGWDHKGEKFNCLINNSTATGGNVTIWMGLIEPTSHGAKGELESMMKSYEINGIDSNVIRAESITFDGPKQHTGKHNGVGVRYQRNCTENGFEYIPPIIVCNGHNTQNMKKDCFLKSGVTTTSEFYHPIDPDIACYIEVEKDLQILAIEMNKSNYTAIFEDWASSYFKISEIISMSVHKDIRFNDHYTTSVKQTIRNIVALLMWWMHLLCDKTQPVALKNLAYRLLPTWSNAKKLRILFMNLDHSDVLNFSLNMIFQNNKTTWIGDARTQPSIYIENVTTLKAMAGKYEIMFEDVFDVDNGTFAGVPLLDPNDFETELLKVMRFKIGDRYILCCKTRFKSTKFIQNTKYIDPKAWKDVDHDAVNAVGLSVFIYEYGNDALKYYQRSHYKDLNSYNMILGHTDSKRYWFNNIYKKNKETTFRELFQITIKQTNNNNSTVLNCKGDYLKFNHRINSQKTDAMVVETANAKINIIFGTNRNFGNEGINEAGTIAINGECISIWNPMPLVDAILRRGIKPRQVIDRQKWRSRQYNIGMFDEANKKLTANRKKNRKELQFIAKPKSAVESINMDKVKLQVNKMKKRKSKPRKKKQKNEVENKKEKKKKKTRKIITSKKNYKI